MKSRKLIVNLLNEKYNFAYTENDFKTNWEII